MLDSKSSIHAGLLVILVERLICSVGVECSVGEFVDLVGNAIGSVIVRVRNAGLASCVVFVIGSECRGTTYVSSKEDEVCGGKIKEEE